MKKFILSLLLFLCSLFAIQLKALDSFFTNPELMMATGVLFASATYTDYSPLKKNNYSHAELDTKLKEKLDTFFNKPETQKIIKNYDTLFQQTKGTFWRDALPVKAILQKLHFNAVGNSLNPSVYQHDDFEKILFKLNSNKRFETAQTIQSIIATLNLQNVVVPKKWLYRIPESSQDIVIVETVEQDFHNPKLDNKHHNELAIIMTVLDNLGIPFTDTHPNKENVIKITSGKAAIIDTESWTDRFINGYRVNFLGQNKSNLQTFLEPRSLAVDATKISAVHQVYKQQKALPDNFQLLVHNKH